MSVTLNRLLRIIQEKDARIRALEDNKGGGTVPAGSVQDQIDGIRDLAEANEEEVENIQESRVVEFKIHGYFDQEFKNIQTEGFNTPDSFDQHHFELMFEMEKGDYKFFGELEWEHSGTTIKQERAWLEWTHSDAFKIKAGQYLTPTYWNLNHFPTVALSINRPAINRQFLPTDFAGVGTSGSFKEQGTGFSYNVYLGNGRDDLGNGRDSNNSKAFGQKFMYSFDALDQLDFTIHHFEDTRATGLDGVAVTGKGEYEAWQYELQARKDEWGLLGAWASADHDNTALAKGTLESEGWYLQPSYGISDRFRLYYRLENYDTDKDNIVGRDKDRDIVGLVYQANSYTRLKLEFLQEEFDDLTKKDTEELWSAVTFWF